MIIPQFFLRSIVSSLYTVRRVCLFFSCLHFLERDLVVEKAHFSINNRKTLVSYDKGMRKDIVFNKKQENSFSYDSAGGKAYFFQQKKGKLYMTEQLRKHILSIKKRKILISYDGAMIHNYEASSLEPKGP